MAPKEVYFELPDSSIKGIPIYSPNEERLGFGFVEIGCTPRNKCSQLNDKRQLFYNYWGDHYRRKERGITWDPFVFRCLSHYGKFDRIPLGRRGPAMDVVMHYEHISSEMLANLNEEDQREIFRVVQKDARRGILEEIIEQRDGERLHELITRGGEDPHLGCLRGKMAEILALKDIEFVLPNGMNLYKNGDVKYFNRRYHNGTEIDGIITFYGEQMYLKLVEALREINHLKVRDRWH